MNNVLKKDFLNIINTSKLKLHIAFSLKLKSDFSESFISIL